MRRRKQKNRESFYAFHVINGMATLSQILPARLQELVAERRRLMAADPTVDLDHWSESAPVVSVDGQAWLQMAYHDRVEYSSEQSGTVTIRHDETDPATLTTATVARFLASRGEPWDDPLAIDNALLRLALGGQIAAPRPGFWVIAS